MAKSFNRLLIILGIRSWSSWEKDYKVNKDEIDDDNAQSDIEMNNCDSDESSESESFKIQEHFTTIYNELKSLELYDSNILKECNKEPNFNNIFLDYGYFFIIFILVLFDPVSSFISVINNLSYVPPELFLKLLIPMEYILSIIYFKKQHFDYFYLLNYNYKSKIIPCPQVLTQSIVIISVIYTLLSAILKINDIEYNSKLDIFNFSNKSLFIKILIILFDIIREAVSTSVILIVIFSFYIVFFKQVETIENTIIYLDNMDFTKKNSEQLSFMCKQIIQIRHQLHKSIKYMENMFSCLVIIGGITIGYIIRSYKKYSISEMGLKSISIYVLLQCLFFYLIYIVTNQKERLHKLVNSPKIVTNFLSRIEDDNDNLILDINQKQLNLERNNASSIDWLILNNVLNQKWTEFTVFGITIEDGTLLKNCVLLGTLLIIL